MSTDTVYFTYTPHPLGLRFRHRLENWWHGVRARRDTLKRFCMEVGIEYPPVHDKKYHVPAKYLVESSWIKNSLGKMRDDIIAKQSTAYHGINDKIRIVIDQRRGEVERNQQFLAEAKGSLANAQNRLRAERTRKEPRHIEIIALESFINNQQSKVANYQKGIDELGTDIKALETQIASNRRAWQKQVEIIDTLMIKTAEKYVYYATKKINRKLNYTSFECKLPDYGASIKTILEED